MTYSVQFYRLSASGENQSCEEGEAFRDEPRLQDPLQGAQVRPSHTLEDQGAFSWTNGLNETCRKPLISLLSYIKVQH